MQLIRKITLFFLLSCFYSHLVYGQTCAVLVGTPTVNFGNFNPFQTTPITGINQTLTIRCTGANNPVTYTFTLSAGGDNSYNPRHMLRNGVGPEKLNYNLYREAAHTTIWGNGSSGTSINSGTNRCRPNNPCVYTAYGLLPAPQATVRGGSYSAQITATLTYNP